MREGCGERVRDEEKTRNLSVVHHSYQPHEASNAVVIDHAGISLVGGPILSRFHCDRVYWNGSRERKRKYNLAVRLSRFA